MPQVKPIKEWKNIFMDTSFIIDYLKDASRFDKNPIEKQRILLCQAIIDKLYLKSNNNNKIQFHISVVTISELIKNTPNNDVAKEIIRLFNGIDIVYHAYTLSIASFINKKIQDCLPDSQKFQFRKQLEDALKKSNVMNAKEWVSNDLKIVATASFIKDIDVVLSTDKKIFYAIAEKLDLPCLLVYEDHIPKDLFGDIDI